MKFKSKPRAMRKGMFKLFMTMKLVVVIIILTVLQAGAKSIAQVITIHQKNIPLDKALTLIETKTGYHFIYDTQLEQFKSNAVTVDINKGSISAVLDQCIKGLPISYTIEQQTVALKVITRSAPVNDQLVDQTITGTVTDESGQPVPGVSVVLKGTNFGQTTDNAGKYSIRVSNSDAVLVFSSIGYNTKEVSVSGRNTINISLTAKANGLNDVVVVGYGTQKKGTITGAIATVKTEDLTVAPVASTINSLAGRLPGLISQQSSGQPGADQASISIRGFGQAIWIVDGVESDFNNIDPNQIESISILKDGAASIYGARAGNGVVLVTTKRGKEGTPDVTFNSSFTLQGNTYMAKPVSSAEYAQLENEMYGNEGKQLPYTQDQINKYAAGNDPAYPNTNWQKVATIPLAPQNNQNVSVRGGSDKLKYFGFFGYLDQNPIWRNNGGGYKRYNVQSNIDANITNNLSIQVDLSAINEYRSQPVRGESAGINTLWQDLWNSLPIYPAALPDPTFYSYANGQGVGSIALVSNEDIAGYDKVNSQELKGTFVANYKIRAIEGLSLKAFINYTKNSSTDKNFSKPYSFYTYNYDTKQYTLAGALGTQAQLIYQLNNAENLDRQFSLNYDHTFGQNHHITALALYEAIDYNTTYLTAGRTNFLTDEIEELFAGATQTATANSSATEMGRASYVGRINYSYKNKYILETILRADASAQFPPDHRWGYFPSVSAGWRLDQENFMKNSSAVDELKLRASYGSSGIDALPNGITYPYVAGYSFGGYYLFGNNTSLGIASTGLANPNLTWERVSIYDAGTDFSLWKRKLFGTADVFYRKLSGIPVQPILTLPSTFGATLPPENLNSQNNRGFELSLGTSGNIGRLQYTVIGNLSWARAKWAHYEEPVYTDPDQKRVYQLSGQWTDQVFGYKSDGLFTSQDQINALKFQYPGGNAQLHPGDVKYIDVNGDGTLDWRDEVKIGKGTVPEWMTGANFNLKYKDFDLQSLFQGAFGYYTNVNLQQGGINFSQVVYDERWTPAKNNASAGVPRLGGASSNGLFSDFYFKKTSYLRLKSLALGYNLPHGLLSKANIKNLRVFVAGTNLLTISSLSKYDIDPEAPTFNNGTQGEGGYYYPQQRTVSIGLNVTL
jgi:TonB-linked SusC/RagA family outer membrane protein